MSYKKESEMYPDIVKWLSANLKEYHPKTNIDVYDTHSFPLNEYISKSGLESFFSDGVWQTYEIRVDVTAFLRYRDKRELVFVECKLPAASLADISQLLGYSRVASPLVSLLISTHGVTSAVSSLLNVYQRTDILEYHWEKGKLPRSIIIGTWNQKTKSVEPASLLPPGAKMFSG